MELPIQNSDQRWLFSDVEETKLSNSEDAETTELAISQNQPPCPAREARSLIHAEACPYSESSTSLRWLADLLGSGMLGEKGLEDQCDEELFGLEFFDELVIPGCEDLPFNPPSFRFITPERDDFLTSPVTPDPLPGHLPLAGRSLSSCSTEDCHSPETSFARLPDGTGNGRTFSPCVGSEREEHMKLKAASPVASPVWDPFSAVRCADTDLMREQLASQVSLDCPNRARFAFTNHEIEVEEHDWTFDLDEFLQFCQLDFFDLFSPSKAMADETYNPFTTKLHPGVWLNHCVPVVA